MASYLKEFTEDLGVADRHTWSEMIYSWDTYTGTWDSYGDIAIQRILTTKRIFTETLNHTENFSNFVYHNFIKNLNDTISISENIAKKTIKNISEIIEMSVFSRASITIKTLMETLNIRETNITWDIMTDTWDDYTEKWDYYSKAFNIIRIRVKNSIDSLNLSESIENKIRQFIKFTYLKTREVAFWGKAIGMGAIGKVGGEKLFGRLSNDKLNGKLKSEKLFGKIIKG